MTEPPAAWELELALGFALFELLKEMIPRAAKAGNRRFELVPPADFEQFMWERVLKDPAKYRKLLSEERDGVIWEELRRASTRLGKNDDRFRRAQRASATGYRTVDEQFYARKQLRAILPELIECEWDLAVAMERALSGSAGSAVKVQVSSSEDAFERYMVTMIDVIHAFKRLSGYHQSLIRAYYSESQEDTDQGRWERESRASSMGLTLKALQRRVDRAVDALVKELGGVNPWLRGSQDS